MGREPEHIISREQELRLRVEEQHQELASLREQTRDKDAAINFLKTKITSFVNKADPTSAGHILASTPAQDDACQMSATYEEDEFKRILIERERRIEELEFQIVFLQDQLEPQVAAMREEMQQREIMHAGEVANLRQQIDNAHVVLDGSAKDEADELRQRLQFRDEQVHSLGQAYESLQHQCQVQVRSGEEELQRKDEDNCRLSEQLKQARAEVESLHRELRLREEEIAKLADSLQAFRDKEAKGSHSIDMQRVTNGHLHLAQPDSIPLSASSLGRGSRNPSSLSAALSNAFVESMALDESRHGGSSSSRGSPRAPPTPHSVSNAVMGKLDSAMPVESIMLQEEDRWAERVTPIGTTRDTSQCAPSVGLQERTEGVLQLQEEIHKEIAMRRHSFAQQISTEPPRCPWPVAASVGTSQEATEPLAPAPSSPPALPLSVSSRSQPGRPSLTGRASTASRVERQTKITSRSGGALVATNMFDGEDLSQKRARQHAATQQRVAKQIEQRRQQTREKAQDVCKAKANENGATPSRNRSPSTSGRSPGNTTPTRSRQCASGASTPTQAHRGLFRGPERSSTRPVSPELNTSRTSATRPGSPDAKQGSFRAFDRSPTQLRSPEARVVKTTTTITNCTSTFLPSSPLLGGSAHVPVGCSTLLNGESSPSHPGMASIRQARDSFTTIGGDPVDKRTDAHGDLHQKFANLRDEMKRQRGQGASVVGLGDRAMSMKASLALGGRGVGLSSVNL